MSDLNIAPQTLMQGDNLAFLRAINSECIDLIATDPPFNKGKDFHATPDSLAAGASFHDRWSWDNDVEQEWVDEIQDDWPAVWEVIDAANAAWGKDMGAFLCYMGVRLLEMHRVLKPTGSLYLHCDSTANGYLRLTLDAIFGRRNFRNEIKWCYTGPANTKRWFPRKSDSILFYCKDDKQSVFDRDAVRIAYSESTLGRRGRDEGISTEGITARYAQEREEAGLPRRRTRGEVATEFGDGKVPEDWWTEFPAGGQMSEEERTGYPTQKPVALYKRIIAASSNEGDVVLDPFCGCATTLIAAQQLDRRWLGIDLWPRSLNLVRERLTEECPLFTGEVGHTNVPPQRSDDGETAAPPLRSKKKTRVPAPQGELMPREQMVEWLYAEQNGKCAGCDIALPQRYFELDHKLPRSDGGHNGVSNRALLCGPCNRRKSNTLTLSGLRKANKKDGWIG